MPTAAAVVAALRRAVRCLAGGRRSKREAAAASGDAALGKASLQFFQGARPKAGDEIVLAGILDA